MGGQVINLFVIMAAGVIIADMVAHAGGTMTLFNGVANLWAIGVNGMLGNKVTQPSTTVPKGG